MPDRELEVQSGADVSPSTRCPRLVRAGVRCTISTDSRTVADTTLSHEFELASAMGMSDEELLRCNEVAYEAKFG